jgi:hypothetical protein
MKRGGRFTPGWQPPAFGQREVRSADEMDGASTLLHNYLNQF